MALMGESAAWEHSSRGAAAGGGGARPLCNDSDPFTFQPRAAAAARMQARRRGSLDIRAGGAPSRNLHAPRQRRFSIAIGEKLPLRTIEEHRQEDAAVPRDQAAAPRASAQVKAHQREAASRQQQHYAAALSQHHSHKRDRQEPVQYGPRAQQPRYAVGVPQQQVLQQGFSWQQQQQQQQHKQAAGYACDYPMQAAAAQADAADAMPPAAAEVFLPPSRASSGSANSACDVAFHFNPESLSMDLDATQTAAAAEAVNNVSSQQWPALLQAIQQDAFAAAQARQHQQQPQVLRVHDASMQQEQLWQYLQQQELQLQGLDPGLSYNQQCRPAMQHRHDMGRHHSGQRPHGRPSTAALMQQHAGSGRHTQGPAHQAAAEHTHALSGLQVIEHEIEQLLHMQEWLVTARAVAASGTRAAEACESAVLQHQMVLQQALQAREALETAVLDSAATILRSRALMQTAGAGDFMDGPGSMMCDVESHYAFSCRGDPIDDDDLLYPADAEALLQHFGHYAII